MIIIMFRKEEVWPKEYSTEIEHTCLLTVLEWQENICQAA